LDQVVVGKLGRRTDLLLFLGFQCFIVFEGFVCLLAGEVQV
jgi:hypothetical protein